MDNWREAELSPGSVEDASRTVVLIAVGFDEEGREVRGLFDDDLDVDLDDFFLFADFLGRQAVRR